MVQPRLGPPRLTSLVQRMSVEPTMKHLFSTAIIAAPVAAVVAIAAGNLSATAVQSADPAAAGVSSARTETAPIVLAQFNPCPNGKCRR
jgi:hypothetical protein